MNNSLYSRALIQLQILQESGVSKLEPSEITDLLISIVEETEAGIDKQLKRLYLHLLKYKYQPEKQSTSWIKSILQAQEEVEYWYNNRPQDEKLRQTIRDSLDKNYGRARARIPNETDFKLSIRDVPQDRPPEWDIEFITDLGAINKFLRELAYSYEAKKKMGILTK